MAAYGVETKNCRHLNMADGMIATRRLKRIIKVYIKTKKQNESSINKFKKKKNKKSLTKIQENITSLT